MLLEVRPSEGGEDAAVFAAELRAALCSYARSHGCSVGGDADSDRTLTTEVGCRHLDVWAGTHRIQRIPVSDKRGRRHTSTATVAVLDSSGPVVVDLDPDEVEVKVARGSGPGGQHRNKTESAVTAKHLPTGLVVHCEDNRSQAMNREAAFQELTRRLQERQRSTVARQENQERQRQILTGERSAKAYTWNDQRDEVVDHETGRRWRMKDALRGKLGKPVELR